MTQLINSELGMYIETMLKAFGVALISHLCAEVCRECKSAALADAVIFAGKLELLLLCLPLITKILKSTAALL